MDEELQRTISFVTGFGFDLLLQLWKVRDKLHNLTYLNFYHMLRCIVIAAAMSSSNPDFPIWDTKVK